MYVEYVEFFQQDNTVMEQQQHRTLLFFRDRGVRVHVEDFRCRVEWE